jgi:hypothetical protein
MGNIVENTNLKRKDKTIEERFWEKVSVQTEGCWEWLAPIGKNGYGQLWVQKRFELAHRLSWILHNGPIPTGMCVLHKCDNKLCVRPDHFFLGTKGDNNTDRKRKGRNNAPRGSKNGMSKLTERDVVEIRELGKVLTTREIAANYGVCSSIISLILRRKFWKHVA